MLNRRAAHGAGSLFPLLYAPFVEDVTAVELVVGVLEADGAHGVDLFKVLVHVHFVVIERRVSRVDPILHLLLEGALVHSAQMF